MQAILDKDALVAHWQTIYTAKSEQDMSWTQQGVPVSVNLIDSLSVEKHTPLVDVGGGNSRLVDFLLSAGFTDLTVLDIAEAALTVSQQRLQEQAERVNWIAANVLDWEPPIRYGLWHDRAVFHFLTEPQAVSQYVVQVDKAVAENGYLIIGTFALNGPEKCSGLPVSRYSHESLAEVFGGSFVLLKHLYHTHITPFNTPQEFVFAVLRKKQQE
jgi:2-polyprenyl-3-methyl-5-hydroxy-6-metoxy-1,4-benzoquinol methylase